MQEIWKDIPGLEGEYQVSNQGNIKSLPRKIGFIFSKERILKPLPDKGGYGTVSLRKGEKFQRLKIHRIVLLAFVGPSNLIVNHKNGIRMDNRIENLEYCTKSHNAIHAYRVLGSRKGGKGRFGILNHGSKKINQYDLSGKFIKTWDSMADANREINLISRGGGHISQCCTGQRKNAYGYKWSFSEKGIVIGNVKPENLIS